ncbi:MAG: hypothetical protein MMC33_009975 [Icmadophila ericetorum]|nr:hypothetical protein [Icmadophila ericetorum]
MVMMDSQDEGVSRDEAEETGHHISVKPSLLRTQYVSARTRPWIAAAIATAIMLVALVLTIAIIFAHRSRSAPQPVIKYGSIVTTTEGKYQGVDLGNGVTQWLGMRYAAAPVGDLRFAAPQPAPIHGGIVVASTFGKGCPGKGPSPPPGYVAEDCLWTDVYAPTNSTVNSSLPVYVFIQGGGFDGDSAHYNGSSLIHAANFDMVTVSFTYRGAAFGFLAGAEIRTNASLNNGLKDQRFLLQWVQKNIAGFGGNPNHVTVGGASAGGGSVTQHLVAYGGRDDGLFQAALAQSQSFPAIRTVEESQYQYDNLVQRAGCKTETDTLACLRKLNITEFQKANINEPFPGAPGDPIFPYNPTLDYDFITDYPIESFTAGKFIKVPTIFGDDSDEGTVFTPQNVETVTQTENFLRNQFPLLNSEQLETYNQLYDFNSTAGPLYWQKASIAYGETRYICPGIELSNTLSLYNNSQVWNYRYNVIDPQQAGFNLGVPHTAELPAIWGWTPGSTRSYGPGQLNGNIQAIMQGYWSSFIRTYDPNVYRAEGTPVWEEWVAEKGNRIRLETNTTTMEVVDDEQKERCDYLASIAVEIAQ